MPMRRTADLFLLGATLFAGLWTNLTVAPGCYAQATISTGSIEGTVLDPRGGTVADAKIIITNKGTSQEIKSTSSGSGTYNVAALAPGQYLLRMEAKGFKTVQVPVLVQIGVVTPV